MNMNMKKLFYVLLTIGTFGILPGLAQNTFSVQYSMGFGSGDVKSYISSSSLSGALVSYRYMTSPKLGAGVDVGWNGFYERRAYDTYTSGTVSLSGTQYRYIDAVPIYLAADYHFKPDEKMCPYVGLGVGTLLTKRRTDMGLYTLKTDTWAFALRPEIGVLLNANPDMDIILAAKYNIGFATSDLASQAYFTFNMGFVFKGH